MAKKFRRFYFVSHPHVCIDPNAVVKDESMPLPILLAIPAALATAIIAFVRLHALEITMSAALAIAKAFLTGGDWKRAGMRAGASTAVMDLLKDFRHFR